MSALGDQLRKLAQEADNWPNLTAYAAVVTASTALRAFAEFGDEDEARIQAARLLMNVIHDRDYEGV